MFRQEGIRMPQPVISNYNEEKANHHWRSFHDVKVWNK